MACIDCGHPGKGTRCTTCERQRRRRRDIDRTTGRRIVAAEPWCHCHDVERCGHGPTCGATEDLTVEHVMALDRGGAPDGERTVYCRSCNSRKGVGCSPSR